jgi:hypothetical protein
MIDAPPAAYVQVQAQAQVQVAQADVPADAAVEPTPIKVDIRKYIPENAISIVAIVTVNPPTGMAVLYAPGQEDNGTLFKGPKSIGEIRVDGPFIYVKLYGASAFDIQYVNYRQP